MAKIKQLKDKSGTEQIFPKTKTQAIYNTDGTLLSETLDDLYGSLATIESSPTTTSHSVGEYILYQGQVYKVTSVIASGDSLVVGTNISAVNLGNQIDTLNGQVSTLNSKTTPSSVTFSFGGKTWYFYKINRIVVVVAPSDIRSASSGNNIMGTLPEAYRPFANIYLGVQNAGNDNQRKCFLIVDVNGGVNFYSPVAITAAQNCGIAGCYITES